MRNVNSRKKILINITAMLLLILSIATLTACGNDKNTITSKEFKSTLGSSYEFTDLTEQYKTSNSAVEEVIDAKNEDGVELQYWRFSTSKKASIQFHSQRHRIEGQCPSDNSWTQDSYEVMTCHGTNEKLYYKLSRIDDTYIYSTVELKYKDKADKLFEELGY